MNKLLAITKTFVVKLFGENIGMNSLKNVFRCLNLYGANNPNSPPPPRKKIP